MNSLRKKTDHELIQDFQGGDLYALETLILRHKEKMYTSILFLVKDYAAWLSCGLDAFNKNRGQALK